MDLWIVEKQGRVEIKSGLHDFHVLVEIVKILWNSHRDFWYELLMCIYSIVAVNAPVEWVISLQIFSIYPCFLHIFKEYKYVQAYKKMDMQSFWHAMLATYIFIPFHITQVAGCTTY